MPAAARRGSADLSSGRRTARLRLASLLTLAAFGVAGARLAKIQLIEHSHYSDLADAQHTHRVTLEPARGRIFDRNGFLLAGNTPVVTFEVYWPGVPEGSEGGIDSLCRLLDPGREPDRRGVNQVIARDMSFDQALPLLAGGLPRGVNWRVGERRTYPLEDAAATILGRCGPCGPEGLEAELDDLLSGTEGVRFVERSAYPGLSITDPSAENIAPRDGTDIVLTIDSRFQCIVQEELQMAVEESQASWGAAVVVDPSCGDILAMGSYPVRSADGALAANNCIASMHEPGSTFKIVTLAACLEGGLVTAPDSFDCSAGKIPVADRTISDCHTFGVLTVEEIIAHSSNVGTIRMAQLLDDSTLYGTCRDFGFGSLTGIELPGERAGILRPPSEWSGLSHASIAIGQEVAVTPLQLAMAYCAVANGGMLYQPRLVMSSVSDGEERDWSLFPSRRVMSEETSAEMRRILRCAVQYGTGTSASLDAVGVAGKTGTAERLGLGRGVYLSAFAGMLPADDPSIVAVVVIDAPSYEYRYGSTLAAPAFRRIVERILACEPALALARSGS